MSSDNERTERYELQRVEFVPKQLRPKILYVAEEYEVAVHLCACGCGSKIVTPLGPAEWRFYQETLGPTLYPSVGNWQLPCQSHYVISGGKVQWARKWSAEQIETGRRAEEARRHEHYATRELARKPASRLLNWLREIFKNLT